MYFRVLEKISIDLSYLHARIVNVWTQKDIKVQVLQNEPFLQMRLCDGVSQVHHVLLDFIQVIHFEMMQTTMLNATLVMELFVTNPGQCGTTSAVTALIVNVLKSNTKGLGHLLCDYICTNE